METGNFLNNIIGVAGLVLTFGVAIFVHELGHFLAARLRGVGVEAFAIGMGPKLFAWSRGGTEYSLRLLPVGGFVKLHQMIREEAEEAEAATAESQNAGGGKSIGEAAHEDMAALYDKGLVTKLLVFTAGVFFNFLAAIAAMSMMYSIGYEEPLPGPAWVGAIAADSPVAKAGLQKGDTFVEIEGTAVRNWDDASTAFQNAESSGSGADGISAKVERNGQTVALDLPPLTETTAADFFKGEHGNWTWELKPFVGGVIPFKPASKAGLKEGDLITAIDGNPIGTWSEMSSRIRSNLGVALEITVERPGELEPLKFIVIPEEDAGEPGTGIIGIGPGTGVSERVEEPILTAVGRAPGRTWERLEFIAMQNYMVLRHASFREIREGMGGPVAIATLTFTESKKGLIPALRWFINLNLILAIMNLLPIPVLDGGFIVLSVIESVIRHPVPTRILNPVYTFFALCFITLLVLVSYQDILRAIF